MKKIILSALLVCCSFCARAQKVMTTQTVEGGISAINIEGDSTHMNWMQQPDGQQYKWIDAKYQWGLGTLLVDGQKLSWTKAESVKGGVATFRINDALTLTVKRQQKGNDLCETYTFSNRGKKDVALSAIDINTPFNDNYPDAETCVNRRCHAHIWAAGTASYVCAIRMGAYAPHLGLMLTEGALEGYSVKERGRDKDGSNTRGVLCLNPQSVTLRPGKSYSVSWTLFAHKGWDDFFAQVKARGGMVCSADKYVAQVGERVIVTTETKKGKQTFDYVVEQTGDIRIPVKWKGGETFIEVLGVSNYEAFINRRANFMLDYQQYNRPGDKRDGALLPYSNTTDSLYLNWLKPKNWSDANEGRERVGGAIFLAYIAEKTHSDRLLYALDRYARFVRTQLQDENFDTWSDADRAKSRISSGNQRRRIYNYAWITHFYCEMFEATRDKKYLQYAYCTQKACYRNGGYNFYSIDVPVVQSLNLLRDNGMPLEADTLLGEYRKVAEHYMKNGLHYPKSEVNYEQSIVAPSVDFLLEMYLVTHEKRYLDTARTMMPVVEAFGGRQPSSHFHDISIRHWDGYWFGIPQQWGDTMPHYWSCINADCFANYSRCIEQENPQLAAEYMSRAKAICLQNLSLFTEEGRAGAAFIYPSRIDNVPAHGLNPFANDQDFALMYFMKIM